MGQGVSIVVLVAFIARDRLEARHVEAATTQPPNVAMTEKTANHEAAVVHARSAVPDTPTVWDKPSLGCRLNLHHLWQWESPPEGKKFGRCQKCGKINDKWVGSWPKFEGSRSGYYS